MANEFAHVSVGTQLTQAEYEGILGHKFDGQATGDLMYASSAVQLSRLAITNDRVLISSGGIPVWSADLPEISVATSLSITHANDPALYLLEGATQRVAFQYITASNWLALQTGNGIGTPTTRFTIGDLVGTAVMTITNTILTFGTTIDSALVADEVSIGGYDIAPGQRSLAISQENPVIVEAVGASDRTLPVRINGATFKIMLHT